MITVGSLWIEYFFCSVTHKSYKYLLFTICCHCQSSTSPPNCPGPANQERICTEPHSFYDIWIIDSGLFCCWTLSNCLIK